MKDHSCSWIIWSIIVILALALGLYAGHQISRAISDIKIMDLEVQLETANASLAEVNVELAFWKSTLRGLADGSSLKLSTSRQPHRQETDMRTLILIGLMFYGLIMGALFGWIAKSARKEEK